MGKGVTFNEKDEKLVRKIEEYQKKKGLTSFVAAVRELLKLKNLLDLGILTQEQFDAKKKELLGL